MHDYPLVTDLVARAGNGADPRPLPGQAPQRSGGGGADLRRNRAA
jgi:hypothetical protein